jgi:hypothetical protein
MPAQRHLTQRLSIVIIAAFLAATVIALAFATQPVSATPGNGNGNPNPHKYTPTPTPNLTGTFFAGQTATHQNDATWTAIAVGTLTAQAQMTGSVLTQTQSAVGTTTQSAIWTLTAQAPAPEP